MIFCLTRNALRNKDVRKWRAINITPQHETMVPVLRVPAIAFLYILGKAEAEGQNGKMQQVNSQNGAQNCIAVLRAIELTPKPCFHYNYGQPVA